MQSPLDDYCLIYEVTSLPVILYASREPASAPLTFNDFNIPIDLVARPIEVRISIYEIRTGDLVDLTSEMMPASSPIIQNALNIIPLKMIYALMKKMVAKHKQLQAIIDHQEAERIALQNERLKSRPEVQQQNVETQALQ